MLGNYFNNCTVGSDLDGDELVLQFVKILLFSKKNQLKISIRISDSDKHQTSSSLVASNPFPFVLMINVNGRELAKLNKLNLDDMSVMKLLDQI